MSITGSALEEFRELLNEVFFVSPLQGSADAQIVAAAILVLADAVKDAAIEMSDVNEAAVEIKQYIKAKQYDE